MSRSSLERSSTTDTKGSDAASIKSSSTSWSRKGLLHSGKKQQKELEEKERKERIQEYKQNLGQYKKDHDIRTKGVEKADESNRAKKDELDTSIVKRLIDNHQNIDQESRESYLNGRMALNRDIAIGNQKTMDDLYKIKGDVQHTALGARIDEIQLEDNSKKNRTWKLWGKQKKIAALREALEGQYRRVRNQVNLGDSRNSRALGQPSSSMDGVKDYSLGDLSHLTKKDVENYGDGNFKIGREALVADHKGAQDRLHKERALRTEIRELGIKSNKLEEEINRLKLGRGVINEKGGFTLPIDRQIAQAEEEKASIEKEEKALIEKHGEAKKSIKELEDTKFGELVNDLRRREIAERKGLKVEDIPNLREKDIISLTGEGIAKNAGLSIESIAERLGLEKEDIANAAAEDIAGMTDLETKDIAREVNSMIEEAINGKRGIITVSDNPGWKDNTPNKEKSNKLSDSMKKNDEILGAREGNREIRRARRALIDEFQKEMDTHSDNHERTIREYGQEFHDLNQEGLLLQREKTDKVRQKRNNVDDMIIEAESSKDKTKYDIKKVERRLGKVKYDTFSGFCLKAPYLLTKYGYLRSKQGATAGYRLYLDRRKSGLEKEIKGEQGKYDEARGKLYNKSLGEELKGHDQLLQHLEDKNLLAGFQDFPRPPLHGHEDGTTLGLKRGYRMRDEVDNFTNRSKDRDVRKRARRQIREHRKAWGAIEMQEDHLHTEWDKTDAAYRAAREKAIDLMKGTKIENLRDEMKNNQHLREALKDMRQHGKRLEELNTQIEGVKDDYREIQRSYGQIGFNKIEVPSRPGGAQGWKDETGAQRGQDETGAQGGKDTEESTGPKTKNKGKGFLNGFFDAIYNMLGNLEDEFMDLAKRESRNT